MPINARRFVFLLTLMLAGCASGPDFPSLKNQPSPRDAIAASAREQSIVWGGVIINAINLATSTRLEVLSYPLDRQHRPKTSKTAEGRFFVEKDGYLETADYAPGRQVTVHGQIIRIEKGEIGAADYDFPLIRAADIFLWPKSSQRDSSESRIHFGFGVILSN